MMSSRNAGDHVSATLRFFPAAGFGEVAITLSSFGTTATIADVTAAFAFIGALAFGFPGDFLIAFVTFFAADFAGFFDGFCAAAFAAVAAAFDAFFAAAFAALCICFFLCYYFQHILGEHHLLHLHDAGSL